MRSLKAIASVLMVLGWSLVVVVSASATTHAKKKPVCATPKGDVVVTRDAAAVVTKEIPTTSGGPSTFSDCSLSTGRVHGLVTVDGGTDPFIATISNLSLKGNYLAFVESVASSVYPEPGPLMTELVNVVTNKNRTVTAPASFLTSMYYSQGAGQSLALSSEGVVAATGTLYSNTAQGEIPVEEYVLAFQVPAGTSTVVAIGAPGTLANLRIFQCAAGCSSTAPALVGWTSSGTAEYAGA